MKTIKLHRKIRTHDNPDLAGATQVFVTLQSLPTEVETVKVGPGALGKKLFLESSFQGNWAYAAGTGTDPRDRVFNVQRQAEFYDPHGYYQSIWATRPIPQ